MAIIHNFVVLEGGDGSGTSTQLDQIRRRFAASPALPPLHATFEPTEGPLGRLIREALGGRLSLTPETLARLFSADRQEHLYGKGGIAERCGGGTLVISDRYVLSSLVYQGITCGNSLPELLNAGFPLPELLLFFDLDPDIAVKRLETRPGRDIFEYRDFQIRVRDGYLKLLPWCTEQGAAVACIDASQSPEEVAEAVWRVLEKMPIFKEAAGGAKGETGA
jgi:dTMP kinase